jgi:hypothetical protein
MSTRSFEVEVYDLLMPTQRRQLVIGRVDNSGGLYQ